MQVNEELKQYFRPEFLNRLDEIIVFRQLTKLEVKEIATIMLKEVFKRLEKKGIDLQVCLLTFCDMRFVAPFSMCRNLGRICVTCGGKEGHQGFSS